MSTDNTQPEFQRPVQKVGQFEVIKAEASKRQDMADAWDAYLVARGYAVKSMSYKFDQYGLIAYIVETPDPAHFSYIERMMRNWEVRLDKKDFHNEAIHGGLFKLPSSYIPKP